MNEEERKKQDELGFAKNIDFPNSTSPNARTVDSDATVDSIKIDPETLEVNEVINFPNSNEDVKINPETGYEKNDVSYPTQSNLTKNAEQTSSINFPNSNKSVSNDQPNINVSFPDKDDLKKDGPIDTDGIIYSNDLDIKVEDGITSVKLDDITPITKNEASKITFPSKDGFKKEETDKPDIIDYPNSTRIIKTENGVTEIEIDMPQTNKDILQYEQNNDVIFPNNDGLGEEKSQDIVNFPNTNQNVNIKEGFDLEKNVVYKTEIENNKLKKNWLQRLKEALMKPFKKKRKK